MYQQTVYKQENYDYTNHTQIIDQCTLRCGPAKSCYGFRFHDNLQGILEGNEGKCIEHFIAQTFPKQNKLAMQQVCYVLLPSNLLFKALLYFSVQLLKGCTTPKNPVQDFKSLRFFKISSNYGKISRLQNI